MSTGAELLNTPPADNTPPPEAPAADNTPPANPFIETLPEELREYAQGQGFESPEKVIESYRTLERKVATPQYQATIPKPDAPAEEWDAFYTQIGRPESADAYGIEDETDAWMGDVALKSNLTKQQFDLMQQNLRTHNDALVAEFETKSQQDLQRLQDSMGQGFDTFADAARRGASALGLDVKAVAALEQVMGLEPMLKAMAKAGEAYSEDPMISGQPTQDAGNAMVSDYQRFRSEHGAKILAGDEWAVAEQRRFYEAFRKMGVDPSKL